jgi:hypothetical protein
MPTGSTRFRTETPESKEGKPCDHTGSQTGRSRSRLDRTPCDPRRVWGVRVPSLRAGSLPAQGSAGTPPRARRSLRVPSFRPRRRSPILGASGGRGRGCRRARPLLGDARPSIRESTLPRIRRSRTPRRRRWARRRPIPTRHERSTSPRGRSRSWGERDHEGRYEHSDFLPQREALRRQLRGTGADRRDN